MHVVTENLAKWISDMYLKNLNEYTEIEKIILDFAN